MKQLPFQTKMEVLELYLQRLSADKIAEKSRVSEGAQSSLSKTPEAVDNALPK